MFFTLGVCLHPVRLEASALHTLVKSHRTSFFTKFPDIGPRYSITFWIVVTTVSLVLLFYPMIVSVPDPQRSRTKCPLIASILGESFDLSTEYGLKKWRDHFLDVRSRNSNPHRPSKRARKDVNVRDATMPVPSVLHFPRDDSEGKPYHRVFLPGRGWLSAKKLERERQELLLSLSQK